MDELALIRVYAIKFCMIAIVGSWENFKETHIFGRCPDTYIEDPVIIFGIGAEIKTATLIIIIHAYKEHGPVIHGGSAVYGNRNVGGL